METKYHIKHYAEKEHIIESQQSELNRFFEKTKLSKLKRDLNQLTIEVLSEQPAKQDYSKLIKKLKFLVNFGWELVFQNHRYELRFDVESINFIKNPLYLKESLQTPQFRQRNFGLSGFYGDITNLSIVDAADIYKVLNDFYNEISVVSWLKLLDDWLYVTEDDSNIWGYFGADHNPLKTQIFLNRLIESLYLFSTSGFLDQAVNIPTVHLLYSRTAYQDMDVDGLEHFNPYFWLAHIFDEKSVEDYISDLNTLYKPILEDEVKSLSNNEYYNLGRDFRIMIRTVWMNIQCEILPKEWTEVFDVVRDLNETNDLHTQIKALISDIELDSPTNLENLIVQLFGREWKVFAYEKAIDLMVKQKVCDISSSVYFSMCSIKDLELIIKTCYLMFLEMKIKKAYGQFNHFLLH